MKKLSLQPPLHGHPTQGYIREQGMKLHPEFARDVPRQQIFWLNFNKNRNLKIKKFKSSIPEQLEKNIWELENYYYYYKVKSNWISKFWYYGQVSPSIIDNPNDSIAGSIWYWWLLIQVDHAVTHWHAIQMEAITGGDNYLIGSLSQV